MRSGEAIGDDFGYSTSFQSTNNVNQLTIFLLNIQSLKNKLNHLELILREHLTDVICLTEHWLVKDELPLYCPEGYVVGASYCRQPPKVHGGSSILVRSNILIEVIDIQSFCIDYVFEASALLLLDYSFIILNVYRTPNSNFNSFIDCMENVLLFLMSRPFKYIGLAGDFNVNIIKQDNVEVNHFLNVLRSLNLYSVNVNPTRNQSCLDNIFTNVNKDLTTCSLLSQDIISDHAGIWVDFLITPCNRSSTINKDRENLVYKKRLLNNDKIAALNQCLSYLDWQDMGLYSLTDVDSAFYMFLNVLSYNFNIHCPIITCKDNLKCKQNKKWYTQELGHMRSFMLMLYDKWKGSSSVEDKLVFKNFRKMYYNAIHEAKLAANNSFIENSHNKCKAAWTIVHNTENNGKSNEKQKIPFSPDKLNSYFANVGQTIGPNVNSSKHSNSCNDPTFIELMQNTPYINNTQELSWKPVTSQIVKNIVAKLSNSRSEDVYGLSNYVIRKIIDVILEPLTYLINLVMIQGQFPDCLKLTKIIPIFKKGDKLLMESYRPIAIIPVLSKIIESCLMTQLYGYFDNNNLMYKNQFGFRPKHSTSLALEKIVEFILNGLEDKQTVGCSLIDLSKAFDLVNHTILFDKLAFYGIRRLELKLIKSYLSGRKQMVSVNKCKSEYLNVTTGVPQGSVLGPLLYLIYVNDFSFNIPTTSVLYADDTTLLCSDINVSNVKCKLSNSFECSKKWFLANRLVINESKTENIIFSLNNNLIVDGGFSKQVKLLGVTIDTKLSWHEHVHNICRKLARLTYLLRKLRPIVSLDVLLMTYFGLFNSQLNYGIRVWGNSSWAKKVFLWQKKVIRVIACLGVNDSCRASFTNLNIMTLPCLYIYANLLYVKRNICKFSTFSSVHEYETRFKSDLITPRVRLAKSQKSFSYLQQKMFNKLPIVLKQQPINKFKAIISRWLNLKAFYTIDEYFNCECDEILA